MPKTEPEQRYRVMIETTDHGTARGFNYAGTTYFTEIVTDANTLALLKRIFDTSEIVDDYEFSDAQKEGN